MLMHYRRDAVFLDNTLQKDFIIIVIKETAPCFFLKFSFSGKVLKCDSLLLFISTIQSHFPINIIFFSLEKNTKKSIAIFVVQFASCPAVVSMDWGCGIFFFCLVLIQTAPADALLLIKV